jgi:hypothetical protein
MFVNAEEAAARVGANVTSHRITSELYKPVDAARSLRATNFIVTRGREPHVFTERNSTWCIHSAGSRSINATLLEFVGSRQAQAGVIWGPREPGCVICTSGGRHGKKAGYTDGQQGDGSWIYVGQGTNGDQRIDNAANAKLAAHNVPYCCSPRVGQMRERSHSRGMASRMLFRERSM